ncbi:MAG: hypothetical protein HUU16_20065 [Candidatus Omnitrophica bacterium]|nr:hypothetical protein [Candidatus Omnitrophota bacterium]
MRSFLTLSLFLVYASAHAETWVLVNDLPGASPEVGQELAAAFTDRGQSVTPIRPTELLSPGFPTPARENLLILTDAGVLPLPFAKPLEAYLEGGGRLIALGGTLFRKPVQILDGKWTIREAYEEELAKIPLDYLLSDFSSGDLSLWNRTSNNPSHPSVSEVVVDPTRGHCLHRIIKDHDGWDTLYSPNLETPVAEDHRFTCFWAKGGPNTTRLLFEWEEQDGSRWMATVPLTAEWKRHVLPQKEFAFWESVPSRAGTELSLSRAKRFSCGLALSHTPGLAGDHEFWITDIGTCRARDRLDIGWEVNFRPREMLFPSYHAYPCADVGEIRVSPKQALVPTPAATEARLPSSVEALHPRPLSSGYGKERTHRWIPLLEALSPQGDYRGAIAALRFTPNLERMWAAFAIRDPLFYRQDSIRSFIVELAMRLREECFLWEGGTSKFTYFPDHIPSIGEETVASEAAREGLSVQWKVTETETGKVLWEDSGSPLYEHGDEQILDGIPFEKGKTYRARLTLLRADRALDRIEHDFHLWEPDPALDWVRIEKGDFLLEGKPWFPFGVNYMPSSGIAREEWEPFEHWLGPRGYDPEIVERDLARVADMGMNMVSVFLYHQSLSAGNLIDLLRLCERHGLRVNLSLRPGTPLDFEWEDIREMIEHSRLPSNRIVFAYDLAWEPFHYGYKERSRYTAEWNDWIHAKHGSLEAALRAWSHRVELAEGLLPVPQSREWFESGPWDVMLVDYAGFLNDLLHEKYSRARDLVRSVDPNHAVSFRMTVTGDPTYLGPTWIPYDFRGLGRAVDIWEPEGYGRIGGWDRVRPGRFTVDYARAVNPDLPVMWAEIGQSAWDMTTLSCPLANLERVAEYYRRFFRMVLESRSNGVVVWWYAGGFRTGERSDYGILNPDGTERPVTGVICEMGPLIKGQGPIPEPEVWIEVDPDSRPAGLPAMYRAVEGDYWRAIEQGKRVGLRLK